LIKEIRSIEPVSTIVYVTLQKTAEDVAQALQDAEIDAQAYHAGMKGDHRHEIQDWFMGSDSAVVVATIAFGMGIDKANIRKVYHYNLPKSLRTIPRRQAARDGTASLLNAQCLQIPRI
jgi:ATP-dependent DNA helicase RecQ